MRAQILYGPYNMSNTKCSCNITDERSLPSQEIEQMIIARQDGAIKVSDRYSAKAILLGGYIKRPAGSANTFREIEDEFDNSMSKKSRTFRIARNWRPMWDVDSSTGWIGGGDVVNITTDSYNYMVSNKSLNFDIQGDYSGDNFATLTNSALTPVDLSSVEGTGNIEFWIFFENADYMTSLDIEWGTDSSNYWSSTVYTNYEGNGFETGWNYISMHWPFADDTGSPDASDIKYFEIKTNYGADQPNSQNNKISGIQWVDEYEVTNYEADSIAVSKSEQPHNIDYLPFTATLTALKGMALATHETYAINRYNVASADKTITTRLLGSYRPEPTILYTLNSADGVDSFEYTNLTTDESLTVGTAWVVGDIIQIQTSTKECFRNGLPVGYEGVFPRHIIGKNDVRTRLNSSSAELIEQTTQNAESSGLTIESTSLKYYYGQTFTAGITGTISTIQLFCRKITVVGLQKNTPMKVYIYEGTGDPNVGSLVQIGYITILADGALAWHNVSLTTDTSKLQVTSGNTYRIAIESSYYILFAKTGPIHALLALGYNSAGGYADGKAAYYNGSWTDGAYGGSDPDDYCFKVNIEPDMSTNYNWQVYYKKKFI